MQTKNETEKLSIELHHAGLFPFLSDADLYSLALTSKEILGYYFESPSRARQKEASHKLLTHVVQGEEEQALAMLYANPGLLFFASTVTDYSGRTYKNYTPFQAALLCHDVTLWKKIEPCFDQLPNGQEEKVHQFKALYPEDMPAQIPYDFSALTETITRSSPADIDAALQKTHNDTEISRVLNRFRSDFTALAMQEMFFNPQHLIKALAIYTEHFFNWSCPQRDLFWRQVIGYTQRFLPACLAQALVQSLYSIVEEHAPLVRSFHFKYEIGSYFPLADLPALGFDFAIGGATVGHAFTTVGYRPAWGGWNFLTDHVKQIEQNYLRLSEACSMTSPLVTMTP